MKRLILIAALLLGLAPAPAGAGIPECSPHFVKHHPRMAHLCHHHAR